MQPPSLAAVSTGMVRATTKPRLHPAWFFAPAAAVVAASMLIAGRLPATPRADAVAVGVVLDLAVLLPALYAWVMVRGRGASRMGVTVTALLGLAVARQILPAEHLGFLSALPAAAAAAELGLLAVVAWRVIRRRPRGDGAPGEDTYDRLRAHFRDTLPAPVVGPLAYETALLAHALRLPRRSRSLSAGDDTRRFTYHRSSGYGAILVALLMAAGAELVAGHLLLMRWHPGAGWLHLGLAVYGLLWLVGDYRATRVRPHEVTDDALVLRCGLRGQARVPWDAVRSVRVADWREGTEGVKGPAERGKLTVFGRPDLIFELRRPVALVGFYGRTREVTELAVGADDPNALRRAVTARLDTVRDT